MHKTVDIKWNNKFLSQCKLFETSNKSWAHKMRLDRLLKGKRMMWSGEFIRFYSFSLSAALIDVYKKLATIEWANIVT